MLWYSNSLSSLSYNHTVWRRLQDHWMCCEKIRCRLGRLKKKRRLFIISFFKTCTTCDRWIPFNQVWFSHVILNVNLCNSYPWFETLLICFMFHAELWEKALRITLLAIVAAKVDWVRNRWTFQLFNKMIHQSNLFISSSSFLSSLFFFHCFCVAFIFFLKGWLYEKCHLAENSKEDFPNCLSPPIWIVEKSAKGMV